MKLDFGNATLAGAWFTDQPTESPPVSSLASGVFLSASISNWRSLYTELCTALHLDTCLTFFAALLTCRLVVVYGRRLPANLMSARRVSIVTVGDRSFVSVGPNLWNSLPDDITSASSLPVFRKKLKTHLFQQSYPDIIL